MPDPRFFHRPTSSISSTTTADTAIVPALAHPAVPYLAGSRRQHPGSLPQSRLSPGPSPSGLFSRSPSPGPVFFAARLPRTSSLLPPPHITPSSNPGPDGAVSRGPSPVGNQLKRSKTPPQPQPQLQPQPRTINTSAPASIAAYNNHAGANADPESSWNLNLWSASTTPRRSSVAARYQLPTSRFGGHTSSVDATGPVNTSPQSSRPSPRKLQKARRPSASYILPADPPSTSSATASRNATPSVGQPSAVSASPSRPATRGGDSYLRDRGSTSPPEEGSLRPSTAAAHPTTMPFDQEPEGYMPNGHSRNRSGKGSGELTKSRGSKPPSQKAMLSRALQKANTAVQLDNAQNFEGAREAYYEACDLLQQVLQRTSADEDKRKLEAIRRTYTSRIYELDQMAPWQDEQDTKALPARPESESIRPESVLLLDDEDAVIETATLTKIVRDDDHSSQPPHSIEAQYQDGPQRRDSFKDGLRSNLTLQPPEQGFLQSSFSRSPVRIRSPDNLLIQKPGEQSYIPAPLSPRRVPSPGRQQGEEPNGTSEPDFSLPLSHPEEYREFRGHFREESQSWLDPIDESGGSTASSVHSRTSSLGYRRRHIRAASGNTEAEFDTALDAAIEAAYDEGYEPMDSDDFEPGEHGEANEVIMANALRKVEIARERVRQTEMEAYAIANERERLRQLQEQEHMQYEHDHDPVPQSARSFDSRDMDFYDDNSSDEEERILEELTRDYTMDQPSVPRESDSSGLTSRTWHSSAGSNPPTAATSLSTVTEAAALSNISKPSAPPPTQSLPELPPHRPSSAAQSVRNRRMSGQNPKQLKIETTKLNGLPMGVPPQVAGQDADTQSSMPPRSVSALRRPSEPMIEANGIETRRPASPFSHPGLAEMEENLGRSASPSVSKLRKNFSSSSLRSMKSRNISVSNLDDNSDLSPGTPSSNPFGSSRTPAIPALPTPLVGTFRDRMDPSASGGLYLFDDNIHSPNVPGSPNSVAPDAPVPLEPCPTDFMLRPFWLMRCLYQTLAHPRGGYLSTKLFVPRDVWRVKGVKLKNIEDKVANCDFLTAALLKIAKVDTLDADAVLEEMQALEGILEQVQAALTRKLGNEVGVPSSGMLFRDASNGDGDSVSGVPRSASISSKSSSFSWRRLRSKNSAAALGGSYNNKIAVVDGSKETPNVPSLPMTAHPTSRPAKRDVGQVQFTGPNAMYMSSLARLFDAAQAIDQIARQVEDPGLRHADKTQVGLELCTRHAAEFFGFFICRFVLADLSMLLDKFIKRGSEWVLS